MSRRRIVRPGVWRTLLTVCVALVPGPPAGADEALARLERALRGRDAESVIAALDAVEPANGQASDAGRLADRIGGILRDGRPAARRVAAARALRRLGLARGYRDATAAAASDPDPEVAEAAAVTAGALADAERVGHLIQSLVSPSVRTRVLAALALGVSLDARAHPLLCRVLAEDQAPAARAAAALALRQSGAAHLTELVGGLVRDTDPMVQSACVESLEAITGLTYGLDADRWLADLNAKALEPGTPKAVLEAERGKSIAADALTRWTVTYWGIPVTDDGVVFCMDVSGSMNFHDRFADSKRELRATIARLPSHVRFGVCFFNDRVAWWLPRLAPAGPLAKHFLLQRLDALEAKRTTDLFGLLERVFGLIGSGRHPIDPPERLRTVFLLTDGLPSNDFVKDETYIRAMVRKWNVGGRVRVHAIALANAADEFLEALASDNRGEFRAKGKRE